MASTADLALPSRENLAFDLTVIDQDAISNGNHLGKPFVLDRDRIRFLWSEFHHTYPCRRVSLGNSTNGDRFQKRWKKKLGRSTDPRSDRQGRSLHSPGRDIREIAVKYIELIE